MNTNTYDLIIIGGGILGTFHAYHALKKGYKVLQVEKDNFPVGSTVRNFGQVVPSGMAGKWFDYGVRGLEIYADIQQKMDISIRQNGSIYIASDKDETQILHELAAHYNTKGYKQELWSKTQVLAKYPNLQSDYVKEALFFPQELSVEPEFMIQRLHQYLTTTFPQYTLKYNTTIIGCEEKGDTVIITDSNLNTYTGMKVVICNGYEFKLLYRSLFNDSGLEISKLQMMRTKPLPHLELPGNILTGLTIRRYESFEENCPTYHTASLPEHYEELKALGIHILFKQAPDGSIIIGDSHEYAAGNRLDDLGFSISAHINTIMIKEAQRIVPIAEGDMASSWAGFYAQHEDHILEVDVTDKIHVRTGIGGKGMTASAGYAENSIQSLC